MSVIGQQPFSVEDFKRESALEQAGLQRATATKQISIVPNRGYDIAHAAGIPVAAGAVIAALEARVAELEQQLRAFLDRNGKNGWVKAETRRS